MPVYREVSNKLFTGHNLNPDLKLFNFTGSISLSGFTGATYGKAKHILRCLCQDFVYRIWYYKRNRNLAPKVISVTVFTNTDENPPKEDLKRNLCGWLYIRDYILNRVRCYNFCLENDVEEVKVTAKY